jgi:CRISPR-associated endonuclease cas1, NMENI subtype
MLKRSLVFTSPATLSLKNAQLVITLKEQPDACRTVPIEELGVVLVDSPMVSLTIPLINALADENVALIFCDQKGMPNALTLSLHANASQGESYREQVSASETLKKALWKQLIEAKIRNQARLLSRLGKRGELLKPLYMNVKSGDADNKEGVAAKLYWTELFGKDFRRDRDLPGLNILLNYGYAVLRAATARALMASGLHPAFGLFHRNRGDAFPLADDVMEPYRPFVDEIVYKLAAEQALSLDKTTKGSLISMLFCDVQMSKVVRPLSVALTMTTASLEKCFSKEIDKLQLPIFQ